MKKSLFSLAAVAVLFAALVNFSSCEKDEGKLPAISFKTGAGYTSADKTVNSGDTVVVGINANKTEGEDILKTLNISKSVDNGASTTVQNITIPSAQEDIYSGDFNLIAGAAGHTEKYSFTVSNRDGLTNTVSFTLTVQ
ncbi:MAG: hypothetical protein U0V74_07095 [Chitinophagales bacterium]